MHHLLKKGQETQEVFKDVIRSCREIIGEAKAQLELNLAPSVKDKNSVFINTVIAKRRGKVKLHSLLDVRGI